MAQTGTALATTPQAPPPLARVIDHDGTYRIGVDIAAGLWHTDGPRTRTLYIDGAAQQIAGSAPCQWSLSHHKESSGVDSVQGAVHDVLGPADVPVSVSASNDELTTRGCRPWRLVR